MYAIHFPSRSEEHTSELQSRQYLVCRLLLEKKKIPGAAAIVTAILAGLGPTAVAGYGIATRFESMTLCVFLALSATMNPFARQNLGAQRLYRLCSALRVSVLFCLAWGAVLALLLALSAHFLSTQFTGSPEVAKVAGAYW